MQEFFWLLKEIFMGDASLTGPRPELSNLPCHFKDYDRFVKLPQVP
jgi:lipopolysaccharide/colanic/teichoic acid biosynthesis glycosyltransferase